MRARVLAVLARSALRSLRQTPRATKHLSPPPLNAAALFVGPRVHWNLKSPFSQAAAARCGWKTRPMRVAGVNQTGHSAGNKNRNNDDAETLRRAERNCRLGANSVRVHYSKNIPPPYN